MSHASRPIVLWLMPSFWQTVLGMVRLLVGIDLRRPASWIGLAMGGWLGWWCPTRGLANEGIALVSAAALTVAAIGDLPLAVWAPVGRGRVALWGSVWACERAAWPLVGVMIGMLASGGGPKGFGIVTAAMVAGLLAAVTTVASRLSGAKAADGASLTLLLAAASVAAGCVLVPRLGGSSVGAAAVWLLLCGMGWAWSRSQRVAIEAVLSGTHRAFHGAGADVLHVDALPANGPLRQTLARLAMIAALAAMAGWLVLEPSIDPGSGSGPNVAGQWDRLTQVHRAAAAWALFTATWFIGLAVPQATLQDGIAGARSWEGLMRTAAAAGHAGPGKVARRRFSWNLRPGPVRFAGGVALSQAAILGWPVVVCAVLALPTPVAARLPFAIVIGLAGAAAVLTGIVAVGTAARVSRETTFAATLAVVVGFLAVAADAASSGWPTVSPDSPSLPSLVDLLWQRLRGG